MPSVLGCSPSGSRYGNVPNELIHRAGPPFLDNHYRGYHITKQCFTFLLGVIDIPGKITAKSTPADGIS